MQKKPISSQHYLSVYPSKDENILSLTRQIKKLPLVGKHINVHFLEEALPFEALLLFKALALQLGGFFLSDAFETEYVTEICIAKRVRGLGTTITTRVVDSKYMLERKLVYFSPRILYLAPVRTADMAETIVTRKIKSKLYFLRADYHRYLLSALLKN
jgi:hypothetical protein